jgi:hypothetical protein
LGAAGAAVVGGSVGWGSVVAGSVASVVWAIVVFGEVVGFGFGSGSGSSMPTTRNARTINPMTGQGRRYHGLRGFCGPSGGRGWPPAGCCPVGGCWPHPCPGGSGRRCVGSPGAGPQPCGGTGGPSGGGPQPSGGRSGGCWDKVPSLSAICDPHSRNGSGRPAITGRLQIDHLATGRAIRDG